MNIMRELRKYENTYNLLMFAVQLFNMHAENIDERDTQQYLSTQAIHYEVSQGQDLNHSIADILQNQKDRDLLSNQNVTQQVESRTESALENELGKDKGQQERTERQSRRDVDDSLGDLAEALRIDDEAQKNSQKELEGKIDSAIEGTSRDGDKEVEALLAKFETQIQEQNDKLKTMENLFYGKNPDLTDEQLKDAQKTFETIREDAEASLRDNQQIELTKLETDLEQQTDGFVQLKEDIQEAKDER